LGEALRYLPRASIIQKTHLCLSTKVRFLLADKERFENALQTLLWIKKWSI
jgi:hypothetical protein